MSKAGTNRQMLLSQELIASWCLPETEERKQEGSQRKGWPMGEQE